MNKSSNAKRQLLIALWVIASLVSFAGYCYALIDWVQDSRTGVYDRHHSEAFIETSALVIYTVLGLRFLIKRIDLS